MTEIASTVEIDGAAVVGWRSMTTRRLGGGERTTTHPVRAREAAGDDRFRCSIRTLV